MANSQKETSDSKDTNRIHWEFWVFMIPSAGILTLLLSALFPKTVKRIKIKFPFSTPKIDKMIEDANNPSKMKSTLSRYQIISPSSLAKVKHHLDIGKNMIKYDKLIKLRRRLNKLRK